MNNGSLHAFRRIEVIGVASGAGAPDRRCEHGPAALCAADAIAPLRTRGVPLDGTRMVCPGQAEDARLQVIDVASQVAEHACAAVQANALAVVLGGDHTCAVGTWFGVARALATRGAPGLLWIDAHMDAHTPQTSESGMWHGMPLAALLGHGDPDLIAIGRGQRLDARRLCIFGVRSFEPAEAALVQRLGARVYLMDEIERRGLQATLDEAVAHVAAAAAGFGITIDLDAFDPQDAPGVGTPEADGLRATQFLPRLRAALRGRTPLAVEIAEFNPALDVDGRTAGLVRELLDAIVPATCANGDADPIAIEQRFGARNYAPLPVVLARGQGVHLWDDGGRHYYDMMSAYSAVSHGHAHPRLVATLQRQAASLAVTSRAYFNDRLPPLLRRLCELTGQDLALPSSTGVEAVETALKAARKWGVKVKGIASDRVEIIGCRGSFHGRTIAAIGLSTEPQYRDGFGPFPPGLRTVPYGDAEALERAITPDTAAFLVEPVQGEAGVVVPPSGYLAECARICRRHHVLLICDEIQTGLGRTGRFLACEHEQVKPDGVILGKALGGGLLPVSAFVGRRDVLGVFAPGDHGSTFGGNPLAAAVALEALDIIVDDDLAARAAVMGARFMRLLQTLPRPLVREVRGKGLLIGVDIDPQLATARAVCERLMAHGVLSKETHHTVVRFAPPLVITAEEIDDAMRGIRAAFHEVASCSLSAVGSA